MKVVAKLVAPAALAFAAFGAQAGTAFPFAGQDEAGPIANPAFVAPPSVQVTPLYIGQNEGGLIRNPDYDASASKRVERGTGESLSRNRDIFVG